MSSFTTTTLTTFSITHARRIASKVATDLLRFNRYYGSPTIQRIDQFEEELIVLMQYDVINEVTYGFRKNYQWTTAVKYTAIDGELVGDDVPGSLRAVNDISGALFSSFLSYSTAWNALTLTERERIERRLPFERVSADEPSVKDGYWAEDLSYSASGRALRRSCTRQY